MAKRFAGVTSTENSESIRETLQHEHYVQFLKRVKKRNRVEHWHPEVRAILLQPCTVLATECWRHMLVRIVQRGVATGGYFAQCTWPQNMSSWGSLAQSSRPSMSIASAACAAPSCLGCAGGSLFIGMWLFPRRF